MTLIEELKEKIKLHTEKFCNKLKKLNKKLVTEYRYTDFHCQRCGIYSYLKDIIYVQEYYTETCSHNGDMEFKGEVSLICPKCGTKHRPLTEESKGIYLSGFDKNVYDLKIEYRQYGYIGGNMEYLKEGKPIKEINNVKFQSGFINI